MKNTAEMTDKQIVHWLKKTRNSIHSHKRRSPLVNNHIAYKLVDRYEELRQEAQERGIWKGFCKSEGSCDTHDAYDLFA
jgi:hypothetical protein